MNTMATAGTPYTTVPVERLAPATRLYLDFLHRPEKVAHYFGSPFDDEAAVRRLAERISSRDYRRAELVTLLRRLADDYEATDRAREQIELMARPETLVVFAGQQVGLFSGPLYTVYKALTTERWAAQLSELLGRPVIPCFWLSTDDHDFAEVDHTFVPQGSELKVVRYTPRVAPNGDPVGRIQVDDTMTAVIDTLAAALPDTEFKDDIFNTIRHCYADGQRFAAAFGRLWYRMFPASGLVPVSPCHRGFKELAKPFLAGALSDDATLFRTYAEASEMLARDGYHQQVHKTPQQTFLFYQQFKRHSLHHDDNGGYVWEGGEPVTAEWLERTIDERPDFFSPNVLLRPVIQNGVFPTLGVVLGPSETAYYAQIGGIHDHFGVPRPLIMPRTGATLIEKSVGKRIRKHDIRIEDLRKDVDHEIARVLHASFPADLEQQFDGAERRIAEAFEQVRPDVVRFEPTLDKPVRAAAARAQREMSQVAQKAYAAHKRKQEETEAQIRRVALQLFPRGGLQERTYSMVYYWARYGPELPAALYRDLPVGQRAHLIWEL
jgi:bacillithiol biosynthesis cysteine-adding enzyme BshC